MSDTTRKHPRTINEAYPYGARYGCAVERYRRRESLADWLLAIFIGLVLAALLFFWLSY
jgi:type VI protein secretion system component VasF